MNRRILVTRPSSDRTTKYISAWAKKVIDLATSKGDIVLDLEKQRATRQEFESMVRKHDPSLVFLNGHGTNDCVTGQNEQVLVQTGVNEDILRGRVIYALSCCSASGLGPRSIQIGAAAYIGYTEDFIFLYDESTRTRPHLDKTAELFLDPSNQVAVSLVKGHTAGEAHESSKQAFVRNIRKLLSSEASATESAAIKYLFWDLQAQVCLGQPGSTI